MCVYIYIRTKLISNPCVLSIAQISLTTCRLACCIGADPRLLDRDRDVLRLEALVKREISITLGHSTEYVYIGVDDAAAAIVRAAAYTYAKVIQKNSRRGEELETHRHIICKTT